MCTLHVPSHSHGMVRACMGGEAYPCINTYIYIQYIDQITLHSSKLDLAMENPPFILKKNEKNVDIYC